MNLPNQLTVIRFGLTVFFLVFLFVQSFPFHNTLALITFIIASLTDYFDGRIARQRGLITNFGILMDPLVDKILICSAFIAFVELGQLAAWIVILVVARELAITGLRLLAAGKNHVLPAEKYGKYKTTAQMVTAISILILLSHPTWGPLKPLFSFSIGSYSWVEWVVLISKWATVILTTVSGIVYLYKNRTLYLQDL